MAGRSLNVTVDDDPEPGDPPPRRPSTPLSPSPHQEGEGEREEFISPPEPVGMDRLLSLENDTSQLAYTNALMRQATMPVLPPDMDDFGIPRSPPGTPDPSLSQKLQNFRQLRDRGVFFNDRLGENKGFRNPKLLERLRGYVGIENQYGSHLPTSVWNPKSFPEDHYYDKLGMVCVCIFRAKIINE